MEQPKEELLLQIAGLVKDIRNGGEEAISALKENFPIFCEQILKYHLINASIIFTCSFLGFIICFSILIFSILKNKKYYEEYENLDDGWTIFAFFLCIALFVLFILMLEYFTCILKIIYYPNLFILEYFRGLITCV